MIILLCGGFFMIGIAVGYIITARSEYARGYRDGTYMEQRRRIDNLVFGEWPAPVRRGLHPLNHPVEWLSIDELTGETE